MCMVGLDWFEDKLGLLILLSFLLVVVFGCGLFLIRAWSMSVGLDSVRCDVHFSDEGLSIEKVGLYRSIDDGNVTGLDFHGDVFEMVNGSLVKVYTVG